MDVSQLCDRRNDEIDRRTILAQRRIKEEKRQKANERGSKLKAISNSRIQNDATHAPIDTSVSLQQIPPSPPHEDESLHQAEPVKVINPTSAAQETDVIDIFLNNLDEGNVQPEQQAPEEKIDEEIEVEKAVSSPLKDMQVEPSGSNKEDDKVEGEQVASRGNTTPVSSSGAPTQMDVDPAPHSTAPQLEEEERKSDEPHGSRSNCSTNYAPSVRERGHYASNRKKYSERKGPSSRKTKSC